jgi:EF hand
LGSTAVAIALGLGDYLSGLAAAQQLQFACDANDDGFVDAQESKLCTDREFDEIAAGEQVLTEEALSAKAEGAKSAPTFAEADQNGDGQISREEWSAFSGQRFAGATESSGGRMSAEDYNAWRTQGMQHIRQ